MSLDAAIISVGTELTTGKVSDVHGAYLAAMVTEVGLHVSPILQLPDEPAIEVEIRRQIESHDLVIVTGGLGPTSDDMTRQIIASVTGCELIFDEDLWVRIKRRFTTHAPSETNRVQAEIPAGFEVLDNEWGTAPGFWGRVGHTRIIVLPGPPRELVPMCQASVRPLLEREFDSEPGPKTVLTSFLVPESKLEELARAVSGSIRPVAGGEGGLIRWGTRAEPGRRVVLTVSGADVDRQRHWTDLLAQRLGPLCLVSGDATAHELLFSALHARGFKVCTAESCTGGLMTKLLTDIPGSSEVVWGGVVTYENQAKQRLLGVTSIEEFGAVSEETVREMADGVTKLSGADLGIAVSGIAGPGGGTAEKPVGTVCIGLALRDRETRTFRVQLSGDRTRIRSRTAIVAFRLAVGLLEGQNVDRDQLWSYI